jgi:hypothetical protein
LDVLIDSSRVGYVSQHDFADLEGGLAEPNFEDLNMAALYR